MLHEHQVGLLAALRHEGVEAFGELHHTADIILREWRIGDDSVEATDFTFLIEMLWFPKRVSVANVGTANSMQQ